MSKQASYIHVNDPDFDQDFFKEVYNIYVSTSPKYQLIASLDVCRKQLEMEGYKILHGLLKNVEELKVQVSRFRRIRILGPQDFAKSVLIQGKRRCRGETEAVVVLGELYALGPAIC